MISRTNCFQFSLQVLAVACMATFCQADPASSDLLSPADYEPALLSPSPGVVGPRYKAVLELHSAAELLKVLRRAEQLVNESQENGYPDREPVAFILYGDEIRLFEHQRYGENREIVDLAASLEAYRVVDLKVCATWLREHNLQESDLPAFLDSVPYGPDEVRRLQESGYTDF